ncbi:MAG: biotin/lipoyl-containing protein [Saprospiraceae bacterium]
MRKEPFHITVNDQHQFDVSPEEAQGLDVVPDGGAAFHLLENGQAFRAELLEVDYPKRTYVLKVNGVKYSVAISDYYDRLLKQLGLQTVSTHKVNTIKAPMPGLVISVLVQPGQAVQKGDPLLILEAMKMENVIKAASDGVVKSVAAQKGQPVEKGTTLLEFE